FDRPPLAAGHQSPSPSHMKASFEYPAEQGVPARLNYATLDKERARQALVRVHEHLSRQFPEACPMALDGPQQPESRPVPPTAGIGKGDKPAALLLEQVKAGVISVDEARKGLGLSELGTPAAQRVPNRAYDPDAPVVPVAASFKAEPEAVGQFGEADIW